MRIRNLRDRKTWDIENPLQKLASSENMMEAWKGTKLLELVHFLQGQGPDPDISGNVVLQELWLISAKAPNPTVIRIRVDWRDYAPLCDGVPDMHYRIEWDQRATTRSREARAKTPEEVQRVIWQAFGWTE